MLSKSKYVRGTNCNKSLWLYVHRKKERHYSEATLRIFSRGTDVGILAQDYFPGGVMAVEGDYPTYRSAKRTQDLINQGVETIYEATFIYDDTLVAVDLLSKIDGSWVMFEVKSTNSTKPQHILDIAVQYYVARGTGLDVKDACVMHFDRTYVRRGDVDVRGLFTYDSVIDQVLGFQDEIKGEIPKLKKMLQGGEPQIEMGTQCTSPYHCDYYEYCSEQAPQTEDVVEEFLSSVPQVEEGELREFIDEVEYPVHYLDFETIMAGVPMFNETRPYQQVPFQYSLHRQNENDGELKHEFYLAESDKSIDPREKLIPQMIEQCKDAKTILVYHMPFEKGRINEMKRDFPQYTVELDGIIERMKDLIIPFRRKYYRTETMQGSSSIKKVLPALCPEFSYSALEIGDGMTASNSFMDLYFTNDKDFIQKTRKFLLEYCHLDTLAMVKIFEVLRLNN